MYNEEPDYNLTLKLRMYKYCHTNANHSEFNNIVIQMQIIQNLIIIIIMIIIIITKHFGANDRNSKTNQTNK